MSIVEHDIFLVLGMRSGIANHPVAAVRQLPVVTFFLFFHRGIARIVGGILCTRSIQSGYSTLTLEPAHTVNDDDCDQHQPQQDEPLSQFHGSLACLLGHHAREQHSAIAEKGDIFSNVNPVVVTCAIALQLSLTDTMTQTRSAFDL
ncbi:hypothetical protein [Cobetia sp. MB87]|uniref:hypothetical protein n=1 Tax=Cobetia sp. MB87 TaxID=2588451 RepID=UPI001F114205|nr:hypothetical protein [Cobetia sp. MB87]